MKKLLLITMMACLIGTFTACGKEEVQVSSTQKIVEKNTSEKETQESSDKEDFLYKSMVGSFCHLLV